MSRVVVVGAGISGLAAATFLRAAPDAPDVVVLERNPVPGGNVRSTLVDGHVLDHAANGWLNSEPAMGRLIELAGLGDRIVAANDKYGTRWIYADGALHPAPLSPPALLRSKLLTWGAKLRLLLEPFIGRGEPGQTVGDFVRRRLGPQFVDRMVGPMVAGIYAADPDHLSLEAAFPRMAELERDYRSLFLAMLQIRRGGAPRGHLETLDGGAGALTQALADGLGDALRLGVTVQAVEKKRAGWVVHTDRDAIACEAVVLACPGPAQARLVRGVDGDAAAALDAIPYAPAAVVVSSWPKGAFTRPPEGFGVLKARDATIPGAEGALGVVFSSSVFPDQAPADTDLTRTILGGAIHPEAVDLDDQALFGRSKAALEAFLGPCRAEPRLVRVFKHPHGIPQYAPGHRGRVQRIRAAQARHPGLVFTGNHLEGIGVKDCARAGEEAAAAARTHLGGTPDGEV